MNKKDGLPMTSPTPRPGALRKGKAFTKQANISAGFSAAVTSTEVVFSLILSLLTLSALYHGLQQFSMANEKQVSLRNQTFFCLLLPIVLIYYTKLTLHDYIRSLCNRRYLQEIDAAQSTVDLAKPVDSLFDVSPPKPAATEDR